MAKMTKEIMDVFNNEKGAKFLATIDSQGKLNNVPVFSIAAIDAETIGFADIWLGKTKDNLTTTKKATAFSLVLEGMGAAPGGYQAKGTFQGFENSGPIFEAFRERVKSQLNADIKGVGIIKVDEAWGVLPGLGHQIV